MSDENEESEPPSHKEASNMEERLLDIFDRKEFSDVLLEVGEDRHRIFASKTILASYSPFFFKLFQWPRFSEEPRPSDEEGRLIVEFQQSSYQTMYTLIRFMYGGSLLQKNCTCTCDENDDDLVEKESPRNNQALNLDSLLPMADHLLMDLKRLITKMYEEVDETKSPELIEIICKAEEFNLGDVVSKEIFDPDVLWKTMMDHSDSIPGDFIERLVTADSNEILNERPLEVYQILQKWTVGQENDVDRFHDLALECTRKMGPIEFGEIVEPNSIITQKEILEFYKEVALAGGRPEFIDSGDNWIRVGNTIDAEDHTGVWYRADIIDRSNDGTSVHVHFHGWEARFNEWIEINAGRLAHAGEHTRDHDERGDSDDSESESEDEDESDDESDDEEEIEEVN